LEKLSILIGKMSNCFDLLLLYAYIIVSNTTGESNRVLSVIE